MTAIGGIAYQCFADTTTRDREVPGLAAQTDPVQVEDWPLTPEEIEAMAVAHLAGAGVAWATASARDRAWAVRAATIAACGSHYWLPARTTAERNARHSAARSAFLRGDVT